MPYKYIGTDAQLIENGFELSKKEKIKAARWSYGDYRGGTFITSRNVVISLRYAYFKDLIEKGLVVGSE